MEDTIWEWKMERWNNGFPPFQFFKRVDENANFNLSDFWG
jgi:hypothetical protein